MTSVTHLAAPYVTISGRTVQRCAICGEKLIDSRGEVVVATNDPSPEPSHWLAGGLVRFARGRHLLVGHWDADELPADLCLPLVE